MSWENVLKVVVFIVVGVLALFGVISVLDKLSLPFLAAPLILVMVAVLLIILPVYWLRGMSHEPPDAFPVRVGVIALAIIALVCVAGLFFVNINPPIVDGGEGTLPAGDTDTAVASSLGLAGEIVGVLSTVAATAVGGIAGLLAYRTTTTATTSTTTTPPPTTTTPLPTTTTTTTTTTTPRPTTSPPITTPLPITTTPLPTTTTSTTTTPPPTTTTTTPTTSTTTTPPTTNP